jgi:hypothetical protein
MKYFFSYAHSMGHGNCVLELEKELDIERDMSVIQAHISTGYNVHKAVILYWKELS